MKNPTTPKPIKDLLKRIHSGYNASNTLPESYDYLHGNPVNPVVPLDTAQNGVFIIGAYPTAKFAVIKGQQYVPVADISGPFSNERYFDGSTIRTVKSGEELESTYLAPLGISRGQCWITNLVKVFLFKDGHITKYRKLGCVWPPTATRDDFEQYADEGLDWLTDSPNLA